MQKNIYLYIFNSTYSPLQLDPGVVDGAPDPLKLTGASDNVAAATRGSHALTSKTNNERIKSDKFFSSSLLFFNS